MQLRDLRSANYFQPIFVEEHMLMLISHNLDMGGTVSLDILNVTDEPTRLYARNSNMSFLAQDHGVVYKLDIELLSSNI